MHGLPRFFKQLVLASGFLVVVAFIVFGIYRFNQAEPTCSDGIQNQGEEGVDCGFACGNTCLDALEDLEIQNSYLFKIKETEEERDYDVLFKIRNPNNRFGSPKIEYEINLFDSKNILFSRKRGFSYILPGQTKFIYEPIFQTEMPARRTELRIIKVDWERLRGGIGEDVKFTVRFKEYAVDGKPGVSGFVRSTVINSSVFDFDKVDVVVVLFRNNIPVAANRTDLRTFLAGEERYLEVDWTNPLVHSPERVEVETYTNVFESYNFIRRYGTQERFQKLY